MKCDKKAIFIVPWAGKLVKCCEEHQNQLLTLANVIGSNIDVLDIENIEPKEDCSMQKSED